MAEPIKRAKAIQPLSSDHHQGLLLCVKIRRGLQKQVPPLRIMRYARHFFAQHLDQHFREEEELLFPLLGNDHPSVQRACEEHVRLRSLFFDEADLTKACEAISTGLKSHIRFEERELFNQIQEQADAEELQRVHRQLHPRESEVCEEWPDEFWK